MLNKHSAPLFTETEMREKIKQGLANLALEGMYPSKEMLDDLEAKFQNMKIDIISDDKRRSKKVYSFIVERKRGKCVHIEIKCDGGLSINGLITGSDFMEKKRITPNIQEYLGMKVYCDSFDVYDIEIIDKSTNKKRFVSE